MILIFRLYAAALILLAVDTAPVATRPRVRRVAVPENVQFACDNIVGAGYSEDSQQVVPLKCYKATVSSISGQQATMRLDGAISFSKLESELGTSVSAIGGFAMFAANAEADYMRSLQDTDYSFSLNYIHCVRNRVSVQIGGYGIAALSESGRKFYKDGENRYFGLVCGDAYTESYEQGALVTMGLNIKFSTSEAKNAFIGKLGVSGGSIVGMAASIKKIANELEITGSVAVQAFQKGGEPSQISNLLSKDSSGHYYALGCSITAMDDCIKAASGLLEYAKHHFPNQLSSEKNRGFTPLGIRFMSFRPIEHIGLNRTASFVTQEVLKARYELSCKLKEAQYYQQKLHPFFSINNPQPSINQSIISKATSVLFKANSNVNLIMNPTDGAVGCYIFPDRCISIKTRIGSLLHDITVRDLEFLDAVKYKIVATGDSGTTVLYSGDESADATNQNPTPAAVQVIGQLENYSLSSPMFSFLVWAQGGFDSTPNVKRELSQFFFEPFTATPQGVACKIE